MILTALSVVLTDWPPGPLARNTSMRKILVIDLDVDLLRLRQHGDRGGGGMDAPLRFGLRHALHAMHAGFEFEPREHALAGDIGDDLLVAAGGGFARRQHIHLPAVAVGIALIHAEQIAREQGRLLPAGAGAQFEDRALLVRFVLGQELHFQPLLKLFDLGIERLQLRLRERRHFGVGGRIVDQMLQIVALMRGAPELGDGGNDRIELGEFA